MALDLRFFHKFELETSQEIKKQNKYLHDIFQISFWFNIYTIFYVRFQQLVLSFCFSYQ